MNKEYDVVFYFKSINSIGGVESFFYYLSQKYKNIVVYYREGDATQVNRLAKYVEVHKYKNEKIKCNKFFCNYGLDIEVEAKEKYHIIHCDYKAVSFKPIRYPGFKYLGVSQLVCDHFKELTGEEDYYEKVVDILKKKYNKNGRLIRGRYAFKDQCCFQNAEEVVTLFGK